MKLHGVELIEGPLDWNKPMMLDSPAPRIARLLHVLKGHETGEVRTYNHVVLLTDPETGRESVDTSTKDGRMSGSSSLRNYVAPEYVYHIRTIETYTARPTSLMFHVSKDLKATIAELTRLQHDPMVHGQFSLFREIYIGGKYVRTERLNDDGSVYHN